MAARLPATVLIVYGDAGLLRRIANRWNDSFVRSARAPYRQASRRRTRETGARVEVAKRYQTPSASTGQCRSSQEHWPASLDVLVDDAPLMQLTNRSPKG
jgi:hypothetical protein